MNGIDARFAVVSGVDHHSTKNALLVAKNLGVAVAVHAIDSRLEWAHINLKDVEKKTKTSTVLEQRKPLHSLALGVIRFGTDRAMVDWIDGHLNECWHDAHPVVRTRIPLDVEDRTITFVPSKYPAFYQHRKECLTLPKGIAPTVSLPPMFLDVSTPPEPLNDALIVAPGYCRFHKFIIVDMNVGQICWHECM